VITGELKSKIDRIWDAFWSGGISNPLEVIEQITYLLFIRRLDDLDTLAEKKAQRTGRVEALTFGPDEQDLRWSRFKNTEPAVMYETVANEVFPFLRRLGGDGSTYSEHMRDARFTIPTPALLSKVVDMLGGIPMADRDTNGDLYEYLLSKIASAGVNGQFRTPRHIIELMVKMTAPKPADEICDPGFMRNLDVSRDSRRIRSIWAHSKLSLLGEPRYEVVSNPGIVRAERANVMALHLPDLAVGRRRRLPQNLLANRQVQTVLGEVGRDALLMAGTAEVGDGSG